MFTNIRYHYSIEMLLYLKTLPPFVSIFFLVSTCPFEIIYSATACSVLVAALTGQRQQNDSFKPAHDERASTDVAKVLWLIARQNTGLMD
jgi:hypothetical protein